MNSTKTKTIKNSKEKMRIAFINLHGDTNMTAAYIHSLLEKNNFEIKTIHFRRLLFALVPPSKKELINLQRVIDKINPEIILMSVNSMSFWDAVKITEMFKNRKIVWGGIQPLIDPERCLKHVEIIVRGEGDETIIDLLKAIKNKKDIHKIKNVWLKKEGEIIKNDFRPLVKNLDQLPFPDYSEKNKIYILGEKVYSKNPLPHSKYSYNITFSRGCPFSCTYCINHFLNRLFRNKYLRKRSVDSVIKELILAKKRFSHLEHINFWDDVFIGDIKWLEEFVKKYKKYIHLPFFAYGNATLVTRKNIALLKEAGLSFFDLGIQSGSEKIRKDIFGRIDSNEQILRADKILHDLNINVGYDIIFSEFETEKEMGEGINFMLKLRKPFKVHRNKLAYYPNFEITKRALKEKKISLKDVASINPNIRTQIITKKEAGKNSLMNYYYFMGYRLIPNFFVKYIFKNKWHIKYPRLLTELGELINRWEHVKYSIKSMFKMLKKGEFRYVQNRLFKKGYT